MQFENKHHYILPTNCFIVDGAVRSLIYDIQRGDYQIITDELSKAFKATTSNSFKDLFNNLPVEDVDFYVNLITSLVEKDAVIPIEQEEIEFFEPMTVEWEHPYKFSNVIIEYSNDSPYDILSAINEVNELNCQAIEIRLIESNDFSFFESISSFIDGLAFRHIDFLLKYTPGQDEDFLRAIKALHPTFFLITQYEAPADGDVNNIFDEYMGVKRTSKTFMQLTSKQKVSSRNFYISKNFYLESLQYNTYFNGKLTISKDGKIGNGADSVSFGDIGGAKLNNLHESPNFTKYWTVSKDKIEICRECEFRNMCLDERTPVQNAEGKWHHTDLCNYDPYNCEWKKLAE